MGFFLQGILELPHFHPYMLEFLDFLDDLEDVKAGLDPF
jgi:nitrate reductase assembly molybdenum cofactor insertion protein NarJ